MPGSTNFFTCVHVCVESIEQPPMSFSEVPSTYLEIVSLWPEVQARGTGQ